MGMIHYRKCLGGNAFEEVDGKTYCLGRTNPAYEDIVYLQECKKCPKLLDNNTEQIDEILRR